jgi:hypothetical protein
MEKLRKKVNLRVLLGICFSVRVQGHPQVGTSFAALLLDLEGDLVGGHFGPLGAQCQCTYLLVI